MSLVGQFDYRYYRRCRHLERVGFFMATGDYYSINEEKKPAADRVYHSNANCRAGRDIPQSERRSGTNDYRPCKDC
jgi:hypothetical protein